MTLKITCADPMFLCYDEPETEEGFDLEADVDAAAASAASAADAADLVIDTSAQKASANATFTQDQVNKFLAEDRRKREGKVKDQTAQFKKMEDRLQQLIAANETTKEHKSMLEADLEDLRASQRTEQEQREHLSQQAKEKHESELAAIENAAEKWETLYKTSMIQRSLLDAASEHDAFNPQQILDKLEKHTQLRQDKDTDGNLLDTYSPRTAVKVKDDSGETLTAWKTPSEAVELLKTNLDLDGNLFRNSIMAGIGGGTATSPGSGDTPVNGNNLSTEDWMKLAKENPEKLGLPARRT